MLTQGEVSTELNTVVKTEVKATFSGVSCNNKKRKKCAAVERLDTHCTFTAMVVRRTEVRTATIRHTFGLLHHSTIPSLNLDTNTMKENELFSSETRNSRNILNIQNKNFKH